MYLNFSGDLFDGLKNPVAAEHVKIELTMGLAILKKNVLSSLHSNVDLFSSFLEEITFISM